MAKAGGQGGLALVVSEDERTCCRSTLRGTSGIVVVCCSEICPCAAPATYSFAPSKPFADLSARRAPIKLPFTALAGAFVLPFLDTNADLGARLVTKQDQT